MFNVILKPLKFKKKKKNKNKNDNHYQFMYFQEKSQNIILFFNIFEKNKVYHNPNLILCLCCCCCCCCDKHIKNLFFPTPERLIKFLVSMINILK